MNAVKHACCTGKTNMNSFVLIFVPDGDRRRDIEAALHKHVDPVEPKGRTRAVHAEMIDDAEQLPLWQWFTF